MAPAFFDTAAEKFDDIAADLPRFALIALSFPKFRDGRAFSTARLLREKHGFTGELRAVGNVLSDQIPYMRRVGFDTLEVTHEPTRRALIEDRIAEVTLYYQPAGAAEPPAGTRPWHRRNRRSADQLEGASRERAAAMCLADARRRDRCLQVPSLRNLRMRVRRGQRETYRLTRKARDRAGQMLDLAMATWKCATWSMSEKRRGGSSAWNVVDQIRLVGDQRGGQQRDRSPSAPAPSRSASARECTCRGDRLLENRP